MNKTLDTKSLKKIILHLYILSLIVFQMVDIWYIYFGLR